MPSMNTSFLTIAEAAKLTGRSGSTIRRLIHTLTENDKHADRAAIEPSPSEVAAFKKKGDTFTWRVREDIILREFGSAPKEEKKTSASSSENTSGILTILQQELDLKNKQIEKQWEVIHALNDRLREGNILMGSLQQRLALPETVAAKPTPVEVAAEKASKKVSKELVKEAVETMKEEAAPATVATKKKLFAWFRG